LEKICDYLEARHPIKFDIYGFDTGKGLPQPTDYRDTPWKWTDGWYDMDVDALKKKLRRSTLVLGDVKETVSKFLTEIPSPLGAVIFDLDYYSSTAQALKIFESDPQKCLPRILCYMDDIGSIDDVGVLRAIAEYNEENADKKLKPAMYWQNLDDPSVRGHKIYDHHFFTHPDYTKLVRNENTLA
tara:strand:- start:95918 stop:96472 length:555 start_codon:yes stop_codon:yes gene_type:complete